MPGHAWRTSQQHCSHDPTLSPISIPTHDPKVFYNDAHHPGGLTGARAMGDMASALILNAAIGLVEEPYGAADTSGLEVGSEGRLWPSYMGPCGLGLCDQLIVLNCPPPICPHTIHPCHPTFLWMTMPLPNQGNMSTHQTLNRSAGFVIPMCRRTSRARSTLAIGSTPAMCASCGRS